MEIVMGLAGAGAAAGSTAAAAGVGSSFLSAASMIGTGFSALATIGSGIAQANELQSAAQYAEFRARDKRIAGNQQAADIRKQLALTLQRNKVAFAAGGVDMGSVSAQVVQKQVAKDAETAMGVSATNTSRASLAQIAEARRLRQQSSMALFTSIFGAGQTLLQGGLQAVARG